MFDCQKKKFPIFGIEHEFVLVNKCYSKPNKTFKHLKKTRIRRIGKVRLNILKLKVAKFLWLAIKSILLRTLIFEIRLHKKYNPKRKLYAKRKRKRKNITGDINVWVHENCINIELGQNTMYYSYE